jgi:hypothetical protein
MAKVYVSSTVADLRQERQVVMDWLVAEGHQPVHSYRPNSDTVRDSCLDDVDTSDLYLLIVGHRYGFQPADGNPYSLSITQLEFRRAGQSDIPRIALLRTSIPDVSTSDMENPERAALVLAFRAEVAREVRPAEFGDMQGLLQGLSTGVHAELEKLQAGPAKQSEATAGAGRALRLAPRPLFLAGREDLLAELDDRLAEVGQPGPRVVALHGLAGAGKTSAGLEYAHRHQAEAGIVWQFPAQDPAVLAAAFSELAGQLGATEGGDPVAFVHTLLATYPAGWLLIFDNVPDRASVEGFLPPAGEGRVLITTRNALWPPGQALEVPVLDTGVAAGFLAARTGDPDYQAATGLAEAVGGLPLALEQAAAYIQATGDSLAGYLASFQQRRADLLARGEPTGYTGTVATTWALTFTRLKQSDPGAAGLLRLLAFCAPEAIPLRLLLRPQPWLAQQNPEVGGVLMPLLEDELAAGEAVAALRRYSLIRPAADGAVSVHRLVQAVTADQTPEELREVWRQAAAVLIEAALPDDPQQPAAWPAFAALLPHAQVALPARRGAMARIASYLGHTGRYAAARDFYQTRVEGLAQLLGPEQRITLAARATPAQYTGLAGDAAAARDEYAALLPIVKRVLGSKDRETLSIRSNLAFFTGRAGDAAGARDQSAALLPIAERVMGPEDPYTLAVRSQLAGWTGEAGNAAEARHHYAALLPIAERVLGPEHPDTLTAGASLAGWTGEAGNAAGARDQFAALLPIRERVLGPEHPATLAARSNLARWTGEAGDAAGARDQFAALLPTEERVLGPEHPATLADRGSLSHWTGKADDAGSG